MKKISFICMAFLMGLGLTGCSDNAYDGWADALSSDPENAVTIEGFSAKPVGTIDLSHEGATVPLFILQHDNMPDGYSIQSVEVELTPVSEGAVDTTPQTVSLKEDCLIDSATVQEIVSTFYGLRPSTRQIAGQVKVRLTNGSSTILVDAGSVDIYALLASPEIDTSYYYIGAANGWSFDESYPLSNGGGDVYENSVFTVTVPSQGGDHWFKIRSGSATDWSGEQIVGAAVNGESALSGTLYIGKNGDGNTGSGANAFCINDADCKFLQISIDMMSGTYEIKKLNFGPYVYYIGITEGWKAADDGVGMQKLALTDSENGIYTGYLYLGDPNNNGWGLEFKLQKTANSWDDQINAGNTTSTTFGGTDNFTFSTEGVYFVTYNAAQNTLEGTLINNMNLVGGFNGWNAADNAQQMTWNPSEYCWEKTNAGVNTEGWKFTANNSWDINLGGNDTVEPSSKTDDLSAGGKNLGVAGSTIKLYPCRVNNNNIYCTVE